MYRYEKRELRDKPVKVKKVRAVMAYDRQGKTNNRDKKNSVSVFKGKM